MPFPDRGIAQGYSRCGAGAQRWRPRRPRQRRRCTMAPPRKNGWRFERRAAVRQIRGTSGAWPGWHGHGLRGRRPGDRPGGGDQGDPSRLGARRPRAQGDGGTLRARVPHRRHPLAPQRGDRLRRRRDGRRQHLHRDGARRGLEPRRIPPGRAAAGHRAGARPGRRHRLGARLRPPPRHRAPRRQTGQRAADPRHAAEAERFRPGRS